MALFLFIFFKSTPSGVNCNAVKEIYIALNNLKS